MFEGYKVQGFTGLAIGTLQQVPIDTETDFRLDPNQSRNGKYYLISGSFDFSVCISNYSSLVAAETIGICLRRD